MPLLTFELEIKATTEKVWDTIWQQESYARWAPTVNSTNYEGNFQQDSKIFFYGEDRNGMYCYVEKNIPNREMKFQYLGWIIEGEESPQNWENSTETYLLEQTSQGTRLKIEVNALEEFATFFSTHYPEMLKTIKELAEA